MDIQEKTNDSDFEDLYRDSLNLINRIKNKKNLLYHLRLKNKNPNRIKEIENDLENLEMHLKKIRKDLIGSDKIKQLENASVNSLGELPQGSLRKGQKPFLIRRNNKMKSRARNLIEMLNEFVDDSKPDKTIYKAKFKFENSFDVNKYPEVKVNVLRKYGNKISLLFDSATNCLYVDGDNEAIDVVREVLDDMDIKYKEEKL
jgi:hypothetical protein